MDPGALDRLTEAQREVLRLVFQHRTTSEIAWQLGIAEVSVNRRIDRARTVLGNVSRKEAARLVAINEGLTYEKIIPPPIILSDPSDTRDTASSVEVTEGPQRAEVQSIFPTRLWPFRTEEHPTNELRPAVRLLLSLGLTVAMAAVAALISLAVIQLMSFLFRISNHGG